MTLLTKKVFLFLFFSLFFQSCKFSNKNYIEIVKNKESKTINSININNLLKELIVSDGELIPKLVVLEDGRERYNYIKLPGDDDLNLKEIKKRILLGPDYYKKDREKISILLKKINELGINNQITNIESGALGTWTSNKKLIQIDQKVVKRGSRIFLDVLNHESVHIAQSCFNGSIDSYPKRIGLPLEFSKNLELNLSHNLYSKNTEEGLYIEREAFTYSKVEDAALKLIEKFCM